MRIATEEAWTKEGKDAQWGLRRCPPKLRDQLVTKLCQSLADSIDLCVSICSQRHKVRILFRRGYWPGFRDMLIDALFCPSKGPLTARAAVNEQVAAIDRRRDREVSAEPIQKSHNTPEASLCEPIKDFLMKVPS